MGGSEWRVVRLLPPDTPGFINRDDEITAACAHFAGSEPAWIWLTGSAGMGKTTLAVHLGHLLADRFPDGVLFSELRGSDPGGRADASQVLHHFLVQVGVETADIPQSLDERAAVFRSRTAGRRVLVVLDDAHTAGQVRNLLPASSISAVIVTSRRHLDGLVASRFKEVEVNAFNHDAASRLVAQIVRADRLAAEPVAAGRLIGLCGGHPLALRVAAARISSRPGRSLAGLVEKFAQAPLDHLRLDDDLSVEQVFDACFDDLTEDLARAYCLLGSYRGPWFDLASAAAILDQSADQAHDLLDGLVDAYLLGYDETTGRYRFHSLVGVHARRQADARPSLGVADSHRRTVGWYWSRSVALGQVVSARRRFGHLSVPPAFTGAGAGDLARAELDLDEPNFRAAVDLADLLGMDEASTGICEALKPWYYDTDRVDELMELLRVGVPAAERVNDQRLLGRLCHDLGSTHEKAGEFPHALDQFERSRTLAVDPLGKASAVEGQGLVHRQLGDHFHARACYAEAEAILRTATTDAEQVERALVLLRLHDGTELVLMDKFAEAEPALREAYEWFNPRGNEQVNTARALAELGIVRREAGEFDEAANLLSRAASLFSDARFRSKQAALLVSLANVELVRGNRDHALDLLHEVKQLRDGLGRLTDDVDELIESILDSDEQ